MSRMAEVMPSEIVLLIYHGLGVVLSARLGQDYVLFYFSADSFNLSG